MKKRILSLLLCIVMVLTLMPMSAFAEESFDFNDLPTAGVTNITVPAGDYYTGVAAKEAFITYWDENIKTAGEFVLVDCFDVDVNGYHTWIITIENDVISTVDGGYAADLDTILYSINDPNSIYDWWINGTYSADYPVWVNGKQFTSENLTITCGSGTATYDPDKDELTLNNATITNVYSGGWDPDAAAAVYSDSEKELTVILEGTNAISLASSVEGHGIHTYRTDLTLDGDGWLDITVGNPGYDGIWTFSADLTIDMDGILTIDAGQDGIETNGDFVCSGDGDVTITCNRTGLEVAGDATFSGSGDVDVTASDRYAAHVYGHSLVLSGSGEVSLTSNSREAVKLERENEKVLLNGYGSCISITAGAGYKAVLNNITQESPVEGTNIADYTVTGAPDEQSVVYTLKPGTGYPVWVNGEQFTNNNAKSGIKCGSGGATLDITTTPWTVTLNNAEITDLTVQCPAYADCYTGGIYSEKDIIIHLVGRNLIKIDDNSKIVSGVTELARYAYNGGISGENIDVTVTGSGNLEFDVTNVGAIYLEGDLHGNHGSFTMDGGNITGTADWMYINGSSGFAFRSGSFELYSTDPGSRWWKFLEGSITVPDADTRYEMSMCTYPEDQDTPVWESCTIEEYENFYYTHDYQTSGFRIAPKLEPITQIDVTGFTEPVYGAYPDFQLSVPDDAHYNIAVVCWFYRSASDGPNYLLSSDYTEDMEYYMSVTLVPEEGYCFSGENATLNGSQQDISRCYCHPNVFTIETVRYTVIQAGSVLLGDVNNDGVVTDADAVYLLYYTFFGDGEYPVNQPCDFNGDGAVTDADAVYLLYYTFFGAEEYPLH